MPIAAAVAAGELTATEAAELAKVVDVYVGALASREFEERLSKLEQGTATRLPCRRVARRATTRVSEARAPRSGLPAIHCFRLFLTMDRATAASEPASRC